ncbi:MAG: small, acid-soluble spore protein, H family [Firmicutes bacterium]|nr:small, acid-soluble spore protein, H family [Bacillota bacterium]
MDIKQAEEIMNSPDKVEVQYEDVPVWIDSLQGNMANITVIGTNKKMSVPVEQLEYTGRPVDSENIYGLQ